jgi:hypothetical protein
LIATIQKFQAEKQGGGGVDESEFLELQMLLSKTEMKVAEMNVTIIDLEEGMADKEDEVRGFFCPVID